MDQYSCEGPYGIDLCWIFRVRINGYNQHSSTASIAILAAGRIRLRGNASGSRQDDKPGTHPCGRHEGEVAVVCISLPEKGCTPV
jgi:hypothetical protein